jgi:glucosamine--fructose-6-phosphate aminotransferase (isomerizing)
MKKDDQVKRDRNNSTEEARGAHPYFMWEHIHEQPAAIAGAIARSRSAIAECGRRIAGAPSVTLSGIGSSLHAAMLGGYWLRAVGGLDAARALNSFEHLHYEAPAADGAAIVAISHRGWREFPARLAAGGNLERIVTAAICGENPRAGARAADFVFLTTAQEKSGAHTKSLTGALAVLIELAIETALARGEHERALSARRELAKLPARLERRLADPSAERAAAEKFRGLRRIVLVGAGPAYACAREGALKLKEATFAYAEAIETEEFLHGPIASLDAETLLMLIASDAATAPRLVQVARAAGEIGAERLALVTDAGAELADIAEQTIRIEGCDEITSPFAIILSLQLFTYFSALARGCDPDRNRHDNPRYARAASHVEL